MEVSEEAPCPDQNPWMVLKLWVFTTRMSPCHSCIFRCFILISRQQHPSAAELLSSSPQQMRRWHTFLHLHSCHKQADWKSYQAHTQQKIPPHNSLTSMPIVLQKTGKWVLLWGKPLRGCNSLWAGGKLKHNGEIATKLSLLCFWWYLLTLS